MAMAMAVTSSMTLTVGSSLKVSLPLPLPHPLSPPQLLNPKRTYPLLSTRRASFPVTEAKIYRDSKHYLVNKVSRTELEKLLESGRTKSVVVDFFATWCGPCIILAQELEKLAVEFGHEVEFVKIDTDEEYELAQKMEVRGLPTVIFVSKDVEKNAIRTEGVFPRDIYRDIIKDHLL